MISPLAYIDKKAKLGKNVSVEPFAYISGDVEIGDGTTIFSNAVIHDGARIGKDCKIFSGASIAGIPQDLKFKGEYSIATIGDNTTIRECVTVNRGTASKGETKIGNNCLLMAYAHVGHDSLLGDNVVLVNRVSLAGEVEIGDWSILGGHTAIHQFVRIGEHVMTAGGSLIGKDVPHFVKVANYPASFAGVNFIGMRRRGFSPEQVEEIQNIHRILFQSGLIYSRACDVIESEMPPSEYRDKILQFTRESTRGLIKPFNSKFEDQDE